MAVATHEITCFLPLFRASIATVRIIAVLVAVNWTFHEENALILIERELPITNVKLSTFLDKNVNFIEWVTDSAIF